MSLRVAITRALPEAEATAHRVRALGAKPVLAPLLEIEPRALNPDLTGAQALLFTSANGVRMFSAASAARDCAVFAVGDATAEAARTAGFANVRSANGDVGALTKLVRANADRRGGKLVHIAGAHVAGDLGGDLERDGFSVERRVAYEAVPVAVAPSALSRPLDIVLFHSTRAAETFVSLGAPRAPQLTAACFSPAVAEAASRTAWKRIIVSPAPREDAFLAATLGG